MEITKSTVTTDDYFNTAKAMANVMLNSKFGYYGVWGYPIRTIRENKPFSQTKTKTTHNKIPNIKQVYFNEPVTVVLWENGDKTIVRCQNGDTYSKESGLAIAIMKYMSGNKGKFNDIFKKWIPESDEKNK